MRGAACWWTGTVAVGLVWGAACVLVGCESDAGLTDTHEDTKQPFVGWSVVEPPSFESREPAGGVETIVQGEDRTNGGGASLMDYTGDGVLDLILTAPWSGSQVLIGDGDGGFAAVTNPALAAVQQAACAVGLHLDDDGLRDLLLCGDRKVSAWRNEGMGAFTHVVDVLDLSEEPARAEDIAVTDLWGDGTVALYIGTQSLANEDGTPPGASPDRLFTTAGDFEFQDVSDLLPEAGRIGQTYASTWLDVDGDRDLDLLTVRDRGNILWPAALFVNPGVAGEQWTEEGEARGLALTADGMGLAHGDLERNGLLDVFVTDSASRLHSLELTGAGAVSRASAIGAVVQNPGTAVASWAVELFDAENDGDLDLAVAFGRADPLHDFLPQGVEMLLWEGDRFVPAPAVEQTLPSIPEAWRTVLPGDLDNDGRLELVFSSHLGGVMVQSPMATGNHWLAVRLEGPPGNRDGLGARVDLFDGLPGMAAPQRRRLGVGTTGVHSSVEPVAHFGVGPLHEVDRVEVHWADGLVTTVDGPELDRTLTVGHPLAD